MPVQPPPFHLTPAHANAGILDYATESGRTTYKNMTKQVQPKAEDLFACDEAGLFSFLEALRARAEDYQWVDTGGIMMIPPTQTPKDYQNTT